MKTCKITVMKQAEHTDLMEQYENSIEHPCDVKVGDIFFSYGGEKPENLCQSAWESMEYFVKELAKGVGNFYDGCMKNTASAMISCNYGFRPVSFYIEVME
ncbi:MAG: TIGR04076 family protein [Clostridia bacterium]|nr:TIGR04076 family protein [Clostridia bacterium]